MDAATAYKQGVQRDKTRHATRLNAESAKQFDPALSSILYDYVAELLSSDRFKRVVSRPGPRLDFGTRGRGCTSGWRSVCGRLCL